LTLLKTTPATKRACAAKIAYGQQGWDNAMTRPMSRGQADKLMSGLKSIGIDFEELVQDVENSWRNFRDTADKIQDNLSQLGSDEKQKRWWQGIAKEWEHSGGIRLV
jgi:hypothetical protein